MIKQQPKKDGKLFKGILTTAKTFIAPLSFTAVSVTLWAAQYLPRMLIKSSYRSYVSNGC